MRSESNLPKLIVNAIQNVVGKKPAPLHEPTFNGNEFKFLQECIESTFVSSVGKFVDQFESDLCDLTGAKHAIAIVNGTSALHIAMKLCGVERGDEVLIPALNFVASANAISYCGAHPHFLDSDENNLGVNTEKLKEYLYNNTKQSDGLCINSSTKRIIRAIVPTHIFGHPADLVELQSIASEFNLALIEDAAESIGSYYNNQHTGTFGSMGILSFNGNKTITTGGGGAILTNNSFIAKRAKHLTTTAKVKHKWELIHDEIGYNYRMPNINAALGCAQLQKLPEMLQSKRCLYEKYQAEFSSITGVQLLKEPKNCQSNYWLQTIILDKEDKNLRDEILLLTNNVGIMTRPVWNLINEFNQFSENPKMDLSNAKSLFKRLINIPSSSNLVETK